LTDVNAVFVPAGRGTVSPLHADPSQRNATAAPPDEPVATMHTGLRAHGLSAILE
jgi:hypothetical protein